MLQNRAGARATFESDMDNVVVAVIHLLPDLGVACAIIIEEQSV
jgi:hypothetical protein